MFENSYRNIPIASMKSLEIIACKSKESKMLYNIDIQVETRTGITISDNLQY